MIITLLILYSSNVLISDTTTSIQPYSDFNEKILSIQKHLEIIQNKINELDSKNNSSNMGSLIIAFMAVVVSGLSTLLNYKVFKGQSISTFKKNWNNDLVETTSQFISTSTQLFSRLKRDILPPYYESEILNLNKIYYLTTLKLNEINISDNDLVSNMTDIIVLLEVTKKNTNEVSINNFKILTDNLLRATNKIINSNWQQISKFS